jgi:hypothetical protein
MIVVLFYIVPLKELERELVIYEEINNLFNVTCIINFLLNHNQ